MFSYVSPEQRVRADHPLRAIRVMTDRVFAELSPRFAKMYSDIGRPSIPPEQLLRALVLQSLYTVRSERLLMEEIDYSVLFRWFVGLGMDDAIWSPTTFSKNRDRLLDSDIASAFFDAVLAQARAAGLLSDEHFTVDGTLLEAWASLKSFRRKDEGPQPPLDDPGNPTVNFHGESRKNDTHQSTSDSDAQLARKSVGREAKLSYAGHLLLDNRHEGGGQRLRDGRDGHGRTRRSSVATRDQCVTREHRRWRQELRCRRLRGRPARTGDHAARSAESGRLGDRWPHYPSHRVCHQSTETKADRTSLRLDKNGGWIAQAETSWRRTR